MKFILLGTLLFLLSACAPGMSPLSSSPTSMDAETAGGETAAPDDVDAGSPQVGGTEFENPEAGGAPPDVPGEDIPVSDEDDDPKGNPADTVQNNTTRIVVGHLQTEGGDNDGAANPHVTVLGYVNSSCPADDLIIVDPNAKEQSVKIGPKCLFQFSALTGLHYQVRFLKDGEMVAKFPTPLLVKQGNPPLDLGKIRFQDGLAIRTAIEKKLSP